VNALNVTTKSWVTIQLVAPYDLLIAIRASCRSRMWCSSASAPTALVSRGTREARTGARSWLGLIAAAALSLALALATWPFLALDAVDLLLHGNVGGQLASAASPTVAVAVAGFCEAPVGRQAPQGCARGRRGLAPGI